VRKLAQFSFIGFMPRLVVSVKDGEVKLKNMETDEYVRIEVADPLEVIKEILGKKIDHKGFIFLGGAVGYISYDSIRYWETDPLYYAEKLTKSLSGAKIYLKREDLAHGGAHKINNTLGQALLARRMGKGRVIAETGAGQHGVATAIACAALGLKAEIYMRAEDMERQRLNVFRMKLLGAEVHRVDSGSKTLKDAINEALRDWVTNVQDTYYLIGSVVGPHPYPMIVRDFQSVIGRELKEQMLQKEGRLPDVLVACVGGGSNAIGTFYSLLDDANVKLCGVEAAGEGLSSGRHAASICGGSEGFFTAC